MKLLSLIALALVVGLSVARAQPPGPRLDEGGDTGLQDDPETPPSANGACPATVLRNGVQLPPNDAFYKVWVPEKAWGTPEMVGMISSVAEQMAWLAPQADPLVIGDISSERGGYLDGHRSHRGGMDADIGLYWDNGRQHMGGFMEVQPYELDAETNWLLVKAMLDTGLVERILLDRRLIAEIRRWAVTSGDLTREEADAIFPPEGTETWRLSGIVHHAVNHEHHMHVRIKCPDAG